MNLGIYTLPCKCERGKVMGGRRGACVKFALSLSTPHHMSFGDPCAPRTCGWDSTPSVPSHGRPRPPRKSTQHHTVSCINHCTIVKTSVGFCCCLPHSPISNSLTRDLHVFEMGFLFTRGRTLVTMPRKSSSSVAQI